MVKQNIIFFLLVATMYILTNFTTIQATTTQTNNSNNVYSVAQNWLNNNNGATKSININQLNTQAQAQQNNIKYKVINITKHPQTLNKQYLQNLLQYNFSYALYNFNNLPLSVKQQNIITNNINIKNVLNINSITYGITKNRTAVYSVPTDLTVYKNTETSHLNRFQETVLNPLQNVVILHRSSNNQWFFVQSNNYYGWVKASNILLMQQSKWLQFYKQKQTNFFVVTSPTLTIQSLQFSMGAVLAYKTINNVANLIVPTVNSNKAFTIKYIPLTQQDMQNLHLGFVNYSANNLVTQAFKYLNMHYAWGGVDIYGNYGVDCSSFVQNVYSVFGINLPRNTTDQAQYALGTNIDISTKTNTEKAQYLQQNAKIGDLLFLPGHVMLYLGQKTDSLYAIHSVYTLADTNQPNMDSTYQPLLINKNIVSNLNQLKQSGQSLLQNITSVKHFNLQ